MPFSQPQILPTPPETDLTGRIIIVTGATRGLGYEASLQFLRLKASTVILAVRDVVKGEEARRRLLADAEVCRTNTTASVIVLSLDLADFDSVMRFAKMVRERFERLDILLLNAGINLARFETSKSGHEILMQVNLLSNALLSLLLFPLLQKTPTDHTHIPTITFVGSMGQAFHSLASFPLHRQPSILAHYDEPKSYSRFARYPDTKLFVALFVRALAERMPLTSSLSKKGEVKEGKDQVVVNNVCPGTVDTAADNNLPWYLRIPMNLNRKLRARTVQEGGRALVNAALIVGPRSHGAYISNNEIKR
ncbi:MAG: hypothetical protein Q9225_002309 [Loekoesia sp. 1 TL-2023]